MDLAHLELAPATISVPGRRFRRARLSVRNGYAKILMHSQGRVRVVAESPVSSIDGTAKSYLLTLPSSATWTALLATGCNTCGGKQRIVNELNAFDPWEEPPA